MDIENLTVYSSSRHRALRLERADDAEKRDDHESSSDPTESGPPEDSVQSYLFVETINEARSTPSTGTATWYASSIKHNAENTDLEPLAPSSWYESIRTALIHSTYAWKKEFLRLGSTDNLYKHALTIIEVIRDSIFARIYNLRENTGQVATGCGIWLMCHDLAEVYDFCLNIGRSAFWRRGHRNEDSSLTYTIDLAEYPSDYVMNLGYTTSRYVSCCCITCRDIITALRQDDYGNEPIKADEQLYRIISESTQDLLTFLDHNREYPNLEYTLLSISLDAYLCKENLAKKILSYNESGKQPKADILERCGCFVLLKNVERLFEQESEDGHLNHWAMVIDIVKEYTSMWTSQDLPIHLFGFTMIDNVVSIRQEILYDTDYGTISKVDYADYTLSQLRCFKYRLDLTATAGGNYAQRERVLRKRLRLGRGDDEEGLIRYLVSLTNGYGMEHLAAIIGMASCDYLATLYTAGNIPEANPDLLFRDNALTARCFEKAVAVSPAVTTPVGIPGVSVIPYTLQENTNPFRSCPPLRVNADGRAEVIKGFDSMVLGDQLKQQLQEFVSPDRIHTENPFVTIEGPSGCGKTHLSVALAHELRATLVMVNVLDFLRPQVGASEKLVHEFFPPLLHRYGSEQNGDPGSSPVRCVVALEGCDCLIEESHYMKSLLYALCTELYRFRDHAQWKGGHGVLFVVTCEQLSKIPRRLTDVCSFSRQFDVRQNVSTIEDVARCFELYLNGRGRLLQRFRNLWPESRGSSYMASLRPCDIALICRLATLWSIHRSQTSSLPSGTWNGLIGALCNGSYL